MGLLDFLKPKWSNPDPAVRKGACVLLTDPKVLRTLARNDPDRIVRLSAWERLEQMAEKPGDKWAVCQERAKSLVQDFLNPDADVRLSAVEAIRSLGVRASSYPMNPLQALSVADKDQRVRHTAYEAMIEILISVLRDARTCPAVVDWTTMMRTAAEAFQSIEDPRCVEPLISALGPEVSGYVHREAILALGKQKGAKAVAALAGLLGNTRFEQEQAYVAQALRGTGDTNAIEAAVKQGLLHRDETVNVLVSSAVEALLRSDIFKYEEFDSLMDKILARPEGLEGIPSFLSQLSRWSVTYSHQKQHAGEFLASLGPNVVERICAFLKARASPGGTTAIAIEALGKIGDNRALPVLETLLQHYNMNIRDDAKAAIEAIRKAAGQTSGGTVKKGA